MKCMWPTVHVGCSEDGAVELCNVHADYMVDGYGYCEAHTIRFVESNRGQAATMEFDDEPEWGSPETLQDQIDNQDNGQWLDGLSYNGGGDE